MCGGGAVEVVGAVAGAAAVAGAVDAATPFGAEDDSAGGVRGCVVGAEPWVWLGEVIVGSGVS